MRKVLMEGGIEIVSLFHAYKRKVHHVGDSVDKRIDKKG